MQRLPERDVRMPIQWRDDYAERNWDKGTKADATSGGLSPLADEAREARANGVRRRFP